MTTLRNFQDVELEVKKTNLEVERLLTDVRLILDRINHITGISGSFSASPSLATDHGILSGLGDDDHPHYLLASGTRELTGNWDAGPFSITAETLISDVATGTAPLTVTSTTVVPNLNVDQVDGFHLDQDVTSGSSPTFDGTNFTGIDISDATNLAGGSGITLNDDTIDLDINSLAVATIAAGDFIPFWDITATATNKKITFANFEATLDHGAIAGIGDDDHAQYILVAGTRAFTGNQSFGDFNITNVGNISLDSITSDGSTITIGSTPSIVLTDGTTIAVTLGNDAGDDFTIDSTVFVVEGNTGLVGVGTATPFQDIAGGTSDFSGDGIHIKGGTTRVIIEGTVSAINMINLSGGVDDKILSFAVSSTGAARWLSLNDDLTIRVDNIQATDMGSGGIGFGILAMDGHVHIHTATAGSVTAHAGADELVLENSISGGMSILTPNASTSQVYFGSPSDNVGATVNWNYNSKLMVIGSQTASGEIRMVTGAGTMTMQLDSSQNVGIRTPDQFGSGTGVLGVKDAGVNPSTNPTGGGVLYSDGGAGKWRSSGGTTTTFGPAEPYCKVCGRDFVLEWENKKTGHLIVCMWCLTEKLGEEKWITRVN